MKPRIFLDTAHVSEIREAVETGIVHGIATNPAKIRASGRTYKEVVTEIVSFFAGPIAVEAISEKADDIVEEALRLHELGPCMAIKIPANMEGIKAISTLVPKGIRTNATLIFNPGQALAAGLAGSPFISPFLGRAMDHGQDPYEVFRKIRMIYDRFRLDSCVIAASIRDVRAAILAIEAGADALALTYPVFRQLFSHPLTEQGIVSFKEDFHAIHGQQAD